MEKKMSLIEMINSEKPLDQENGVSAVGLLLKYKGSEGYLSVEKNES